MARGWVNADNPMSSGRPEYAVNLSGERRLLGYRVKGTGEQIRDYLKLVGTDFEMNIYRAVKAECQRARVNPPTWGSFQNYFRRLKKLKMVLPAEGGMAPSTADNRRSAGQPFQRQYYKLNARRIGDAAWLNPQEDYLELLRRQRTTETSR
jgi:hypothetical protein